MEYKVMEYKVGDVVVGVENQSGLTIGQKYMIKDTNTTEYDNTTYYLQNLKTGVTTWAWERRFKLASSVLTPGDKVIPTRLGGVLVVGKTYTVKNVCQDPNFPLVSLEGVEPWFSADRFKLAPKEVKTVEEALAWLKENHRRAIIYEDGSAAISYVKEPTQYQFTGTNLISAVNESIKS